MLLSQRNIEEKERDSINITAFNQIQAPHGTSCQTRGGGQGEVLGNIQKNSRDDKWFCSDPSGWTHGDVYNVHNVYEGHKQQRSFYTGHTSFNMALSSMTPPVLTC